MSDDSELEAILLELGLDLPLHEMAIERDKLRFKFFSIQDHIVRHLIILAAAPTNRPERNHWRGEVIGSLVDLAAYRLKKSGKPFTAEACFGLLWGDEFNDPETGGVVFDRAIQKAVKAEKLNGVRDKDTLRERIERFLHGYATLYAAKTPLEELKERLISLIKVLD